MFQAQFGLVTAAMEPGDSGGILKDAASLLRLGADDLADAPLLHQRLRARAGGGVGEEELHIARARLAAVYLVVRAGFAD